MEYPYALEISKSGKRAHLWVFFSEPVPAKEARALGFRILDEAMEGHSSLSFDSYDQLFPNQDIIPEGGFGNLIALPLQFQSRKKGNTQFVDNELKPSQDQWYFLSQLESVSLMLLSATLSNQEINNEATLFPW